MSPQQPRERGYYSVTLSIDEETERSEGHMQIRSALTSDWHLTVPRCPRVCVKDQLGVFLKPQFIPIMVLCAALTTLWIVTISFTPQFSSPGDVMYVLPWAISVTTVCSLLNAQQPPQSLALRANEEHFLGECC